MESEGKRLQQEENDMKDKKVFEQPVRKEAKSQARGVVKSHYIFLVLICLVAVLYGTEFSGIKTNAVDLYKTLTGQEVDVGGNSFESNLSSREKVADDIADEDFEAGRKKADAQMKEYENEKTDQILGRKNGTLAPLVNLFSSGHFYLNIAEGLRSVVHSDTIATAIFVIISVLITGLFWIFVKNMIQGILRRAFLEARMYESVPVGHLLHFRIVKRWIRVSLSLLLKDFFHLLWSLTIVGYFIKYYAYYAVPYIVAENPDIKPREAVSLSRRIMYGHKWDCFKLDFSFIGWYILGFITFGISEIFWSLPYRVAAKSEYYVQLRRIAKETDIEGIDMLNDEYLFVKAEESFLRKSYPDIEEQKQYIDEHRITLTGMHGFMVRNFGLWIGHTEEKAAYEDLDIRRSQIREERAAIKGRVYPQRLNPLMDAEATIEMRNIRYLRPYTIWTIILAFFTFSLVGWLWEVSIHLVKDGVFINRGAMHGPWLPIYGGGLVMILIVLARFRKNPPLEIGLIVVLCGCVEYFTSLILELANGMRWWDYTGYFLNLNGRICAEGLMVFALGGSAVVYMLMPLLDNMWQKISRKILIVICCILIVCFGADIVYSHFVPNVGEGITDYEEYQEAE